MTRASLKFWLSPERRPVLDAWLEGKTIQFREPGQAWVDDLPDDPPFTARSTYEWRVKPEARQPRRIWVNEYPEQSVEARAWPCKELADYHKCPGRIACVEFVEVVKQAENEGQDPLKAPTHQWHNYSCICSKSRFDSPEKNPVCPFCNKSEQVTQNY